MTGPYRPGAFADTLVFFPISVRTAVKDWYDLYSSRLESFMVNGEGGVPLNDLSIPFHPESDDGRAESLAILRNEHQLSFVGWIPEEVEFFVRLAFPRALLMDLTREAKRPKFFEDLYLSWRPSFFEWVIFLWEISGNACELFGDMLFLIPDDRRPPKSEMAKVLFVDMIDAGYYTEITCVSIALAVIEYARELSGARAHAKAIVAFAASLTPRQVGFVIRSLIMGLGQPRDCECGYAPGQAFCNCIRQGLRGSSPIFNYDPGREYACIVLRLVIEQLQMPSLAMTRVASDWTDEMRDDMIASACDFVFTEATYFTLYKTVVTGWSEPRPPILQTKPRRLNPDEEDIRLGDPQLDFENGKFQTGACIVSNCKQIAKDNCENVCCGTHCIEFLFACRAHRTNAWDTEYQPRKNVEFFTNDHRSKARNPPIPRDREFI